MGLRLYNLFGWLQRFYFEKLSRTFSDSIFFCLRIAMTLRLRIIKIIMGKDSTATDDYKVFMSEKRAFPKVLEGI